MQRALARGAHRSGVVDVLAQIGAEIIPEITRSGGLRQESCIDNHCVGGRTVHGPLRVRRPHGQ